MFYDKFHRLCEGHNPRLTGGKAAEQIGFDRSSVSYWRRQAAKGIDVLPSSDILLKIALFFGVSVDFLTREDDEWGSAQAVAAAKVLIDAQEPLLHIEASMYHKELENLGLAEDEVELLARYRTCNSHGKLAIRTIAYLEFDRAKRGKDSANTIRLIKSAANE